MAPVWPAGEKPHVAVAVSGGPDSTALVYLLKNWVNERGGRLLVLTIDHGLRPNSSREAQQAAAAWGGAVLPWLGAKPATRLMEAARAARYDLLVQACLAHEISHLFFAHQLDDQAETLMFRLGRGSGWRGMAGMPIVAERAGVRLVRPLLTVPKSRLIETCRQAGLPFVTDPGNANPKFSRARWRTGLDRMAQETGIHADDLVAASWPQAARRNAELAAFRAAIQRRDVRVHDCGYAEAAALPAEEFSLLLRLIGQPAYPPEAAAVRRLWSRGGGTLAGVMAQRHGAAWRLTREVQMSPSLPLPPGQHSVYWDRRFLVRFDDLKNEDNIRIAPLGVAPWRRLLPEGTAFKHLPGQVRAACPAIFKGDELLAIPGFYSRIGPVMAEWRPWWNPLADRFIEKPNSA